MQFVQYSDVGAFRERVETFLLSHEVMHNIIIGITSRLMNGEQSEDLFLGYVEDDTGEVIAATMSTALRGSILLSQIQNKDTIPLLVTAYSEAKNQIHSVEGLPKDSTYFAKLWQEHSGQSFYTLMELGFYRLDTVIMPLDISGQARLATQADFEILVAWLICFSNDTGLGNLTQEQAENNIRRKLDNPILGGIRIWMDNDEPVSMAAATRETLNGGNISLVYTPDRFRGHGYASAVTASLSQEILNAGKQFCCLTTDMSNPTSNKIYKAIGYQHVGNQRRINFEQSSGEA